MRHALIALVAALAVTSCSGSPRPRLYALVPLADVEAAVGASVGAAVGASVGVGPVTLASLLDRPQIVTRRGSEILLGELDRWAEPPAEGIARALADNLGVLLVSERIWIYPWKPPVRPDYQVSVDVFRFDAAAGEAVIVARWTLLAAGEMRSARRFEHREPLPAADPGATVEALGRGIAALSREVAREIARHAAAAE